MGRIGAFESRIDASTAALEEGQIAGTAKLGAEEFVYLREWGDGSLVLGGVCGIGN